MKQLTILLFIIAVAFTACTSASGNLIPPAKDPNLMKAKVRVISGDRTSDYNTMVTLYIDKMLEPGDYFTRGSNKFEVISLDGPQYYFKHIDLPEEIGAVGTSEFYPTQMEAYASPNLDTLFLRFKN